MRTVQSKRRRGPKALVVLALASVVGGVALNFSDIRRYLRMRAM